RRRRARREAARQSATASWRSCSAWRGHSRRPDVSEGPSPVRPSPRSQLFVVRGNGLTRPRNRSDCGACQSEHNRQVHAPACPSNGGADAARKSGRPDLKGTFGRQGGGDSSTAWYEVSKWVGLEFPGFSGDLVFVALIWFRICLGS